MTLLKSVLVATVVLGACNGGGSEPAGPRDEPPTVTSIQPALVPRGITGGETVVISGTGFGMDAAEVAVVFQPITSPGDTLPGSLSGPRGALVSVNPQSLQVRVPGESFGTTRVFVVVEGEVSNGTTVDVVPNVAGRYEASVQVVTNPCVLAGVPHVAGEMDMLPWDITQTGTGVAVRIALSDADPAWADDIATDRRLFDTENVNRFLAGDLAITFTPGAFQGSLRLRPLDGRDCPSLVDVFGTRTGAIPG